MAGDPVKKRRATRAAAAGESRDTREKILEVAEALIADSGVEGFRIKDLAERIGVRPPSLFAHFDGREAIVEAVLVRLLENIDEILPANLEGDPVEALGHGVAAFVRYLAEHPAVTRLILRDLGDVGSPRLEERESTRVKIDAIQERVARTLRRGQREGVFRKVRPDAVMAQMVGAATATVMWLDAGDGRGPGVSVKTLERETAELVLRYVAVDLDAIGLRGGGRS